MAGFAGGGRYGVLSFSRTAGWPSGAPAGWISLWGQGRGPLLWLVI